MDTEKLTLPVILALAVFVALVLYLVEGVI